MTEEMKKMGKVEAAMGGIPELEVELLDGVDIELREVLTRPQTNAILRKVEKACGKKYREFEKLLKKSNFTKEELREFNFELGNNLALLLEEEEMLPLSEHDYLQALSDVIYLYRQMRSLVGTYIDKEIAERREALTPSQLAAVR